MNFLPKVSNFLPYSSALTTGILLTAAFPDVNLYPVAFFALVPLWTSIATMEPRQAFYSGLIAGAAHYLTLIYWIVPTLTQFGNLHIMLALACLVLLALYLSLYPALFALAIKKLSGPAWLTPVWGAMVWTGLEFIRTHALTGFPWGILGYSQSPNPYLIQMADISGVLGISFILVACNGLLAQAILVVRKQAPADKSFALSATLVLVLTAGALGYGATRLETIAQWTTKAKTAKIAIIQGNIEQDKKWDKAFKDITLERYETLSLSTLPADLVVWPETALPFYYGRDPKNSARVQALVKTAGTHFLIGSPAVEISTEIIRYYNRAYMFNAHSLVTGTYDKAHLVPFGEYVPLQDLLWFIEKLTAEAGNFSRGSTGPIPLKFDTHQTGMLICFEILFPDISRQFVLNGADILTTITNDAWFGRTSAPAQHFAVAVLRAVENRRSMVRAANTGISGFIDPSGQITADTGLFTATTLTREVPTLKQITFYTRHGDLIGISALVAIFLSFMLKVIKNRRQPG